MRKKKTLFVVSLLLFVIMGSSRSMATSTQWFPTEGTISDYAISYTLYFLNGTLIESNEFDLFYTGSYKVVPSILKQHFTPADNTFLTSSLANGTSLTYRHSYTENSLTQWKRTKTLMWENESDPDAAISFHYYEDPFYSTWTPVSGAFDIVDKNNFWTSMSTGALLDYMDSTLGLGSPTYNSFLPIIGITSEAIIMHDPGTSVNQTYIAGRDGRVRTRNMVRHGGAMESRGIKSITFTFTLVEPENSSGIPSFPIALTVLGLIIGVLIIMRSSKRKLTHKFKQ